MRLIEHTDENGKYLFTDLKIGDYQVEFNLSTIPNGYMVTPQNVGDDDAKDSDANQTNGKTEVTTLEDGENDLSWDMGIHKKYSLGDYVWNDLNKNGIQDADEPGIANVEVELLDNNNNSLAKTTTDSNGKYQFDNLDNGDYQVKFTIPEDYVVTVQNAGGDDAKDSDPDSDGTVNVTIKDDDDFTIDLGIYTPKASTWRFCLG